MPLTSRINHIAMAVPSIDAFLEKNDVLYGDFERGPKIVNEMQSVCELFLRKDGHVIELLEPLGENSPLDGFLRRNPAGGLIHIALDVPDLAAAIAEVQREGGRLISGPTPDIAFDYREIAFVFVGGQVVELIQMA